MMSNSTVQLLGRAYIRYISKEVQLELSPGLLAITYIMILRCYVPSLPR